MTWRQDTMINPPIEALLERVDSKFTLVSLAAKRARQINAYFNQLGEGLGALVPPQVASTARKPLSIGFEEIAADKITYHRIDTDDPEHPESEEEFGLVGALSAALPAESEDGAGGELTPPS